MRTRRAVSEALHTLQFANDASDSHPFREPALCAVATACFMQSRVGSMAGEARGAIQLGTRISSIVNAFQRPLCTAYN